MKKLASKTLILLMLLSLGAELVAVTFYSDSTQYVLANLDERDKTDKEEVEKDKILHQILMNTLHLENVVIRDLLITVPTSDYTFLPEIPPEQA